MNNPPPPFIGVPRTSAGRHAPHAMVVQVRHQDVAERVQRNTLGIVKGGRGARAIGKAVCAAARQGGHHCTTKNKTNKAEQEGGGGGEGANQKSNASGKM